MGAMEYQCVTRYVWMACSTASGSKRNSSTCVAPTRIGMFTPISMPAMWYSGATDSDTPSGPTPAALAVARVLNSALPKLSIAPLGRPVVPLV